MNCSPKNIIAAAMLAALGLAAAAQTPSGAAPYGAAAATASAPQREHGGRFDPAKRLERFAARMAQIKEKLQITPAQEGAWANWITAIQPSANTERPDRAALEKLPTPQRIDQLRALRTQHIATMDRRGEATKTFYAALTPAQQALFDAGAARMGRHHGHGGHHR